MSKTYRRAPGSLRGSRRRFPESAVKMTGSGQAHLLQPILIDTEERRTSAGTTRTRLRRIAVNP